MEPMSPFHVLAKPTGARCNLDCAYCFFLPKQDLYPGSSFRMSDEVLESYLRQLIESAQGEVVEISWQGGEPTLMGVEFYRRAADLARTLAPPGTSVSWSMQTNGVRIDEEWCDLLLEHDYLVGLSLDGPPRMHDAFRVDKAGRPTSDRVLDAARLLLRREVRTNILTTVNSANGDHGVEVYRFLRDEVGARYIQLIPIVERAPGSGAVTDRSVHPAQWGRFMIDVFDEWLLHDVGDVFVLPFDWALAAWMGMDSPLCIFRPECGDAVALEHNGDVYSCDHFVDPEHLLGNIADSTLAELVAGDRQRRFGRLKLDGLPAVCLGCEVRFACHGECPKSRFVPASDGGPPLNYLCEGYRAFFNHIDEPMRLMAGLLRRGRPASEVVELLDAQPASGGGRTGRNDPCPCGSGMKFKRCHG